MQLAPAMIVSVSVIAAPISFLCLSRGDVRIAPASLAAAIPSRRTVIIAVLATLRSPQPFATLSALALPDPAVTLMITPPLARAFPFEIAVVMTLSERRTLEPWLMSVPVPVFVPMAVRKSGSSRKCHADQCDYCAPHPTLTHKNLPNVCRAFSMPLLSTDRNTMIRMS
jgi:hypothetical protein